MLKSLVAEEAEDSTHTPAIRLAGPYGQLPIAL